MAGHSFRGRPLHWDPDQQAIELERQKWVYEKIDGTNQAIRDLAVDPAQMYATYRQEYERTGNHEYLLLALEYVQPLW
jgi:hypothetical protein